MDQRIGLPVPFEFNRYLKRQNRRGGVERALHLNPERAPRGILIRSVRH